MEHPFQEAFDDRDRKFLQRIPGFEFSTGEFEVSLLRRQKNESIPG